jgi:hypothetical protein
MEQLFVRIYSYRGIREPMPAVRIGFCIIVYFSEILCGCIWLCDRLSPSTRINFKFDADKPAADVAVIL